MSAYQAVFQWVVVAWMAVRFFGLVYTDFNGVRERKARGFDGFIGTVIVWSFAAWVLYEAGSFSTFGSR